MHGAVARVGVDFRVGRRRSNDLMQRNQGTVAKEKEEEEEEEEKEEEEEEEDKLRPRKADGRS